MDQQEPWGTPRVNKLREVTGHCTDIARNQHTTGVRCDSKNVGIRSAVGDEAISGAEID
jgi:hypothetical protein